MSLPKKRISGHPPRGQSHPQKWYRYILGDDLVKIVSVNLQEACHDSNRDKTDTNIDSCLRPSSLAGSSYIVIWIIIFFPHVFYRTHYCSKEKCLACPILFNPCKSSSVQCPSEMSQRAHKVTKRKFSPMFGCAPPKMCMILTSFEGAVPLTCFRHF